MNREWWTGPPRSDGKIEGSSRLGRTVYAVGFTAAIIAGLTCTQRHEPSWIGLLWGAAAIGWFRLAFLP